MKFIQHKGHSETKTDQELVGLYRQHGSTEVLGALYSRYMTLVYGVCYNYLKDEEQSKDAVMQIFEELVKKLRIHEVQNFKSWLHVLTRNHCLMVLRAQSKLNTVSLDDSFMENGDFLHLNIEDVMESKLTVLEKCMAELSEEQRNCVDLFYLKEQCYKDIADGTGYELSKVKSYIQNGKRNLKLCIEKNGGE